MDERPGGAPNTIDYEQRLRLLVDSAIDYAIFTLDPSGVITSWNPGAQRVKGYLPEEIIGQHFSVFYGDEDNAAGKPAWELEVATEEGRLEDEGWRIRKDGTRFWANVVITALRDSSGELVGFGKVTRDLSDRKQGELALQEIAERERETSARLRELDRLKTEFVAMVAHDLRSPMGITRGFAHLLLDGWDESPEGEKLDMVRSIARQMETLSSFVEDLLDVARIESGELQIASEPIDILVLIRRVASDSTPPDRPPRVTLNAPAEVPPVLADEHRSWQVLSNLVSNALKFSGEAPVEIEVAPHDEHVAVTVVDRGPGIAPPDQEQIFQRFARGVGEATEKKGHGLGLFIARSLAEAQGGALRVDSDVGRGARFTVTFPIA